MARPLSNDLCERVIARWPVGSTIRTVALAFGWAPSTVSKWARRHRSTGSVRPAQFGGYKRRLLEPHRETVGKLVAAKPDRSVDELRVALAALRIDVQAEALRRFLHAEGLSFKKSAFANEQDRPDGARRPVRWQARQARPRAKRSEMPARLLFLPPYSPAVDGHGTSTLIGGLCL